MDGMASSELAVYRVVVGACAATSFVLSTTTLGLLMRRGSVFAWLLLAPFHFLSPVRRSLSELEASTSPFLRLGACAAGAYWLLSLGILLSVAFNKAFCGPFVVMIAASMLASLVFTAVAAPRALDLLVAARKPLPRVDREVRLAAALTLPGCLVVSMLFHAARVKKGDACVDLPLALSRFFRAPLLVATAAAGAYGQRVEWRIARTAAYAARCADVEYGVDGLLSTTAVFRQRLIRLHVLATWSVYAITTVAWVCYARRPARPPTPPFSMTLLNSALVAAAGGAHAVLCAASDARLDVFRKRPSIQTLYRAMTARFLGAELSRRLSPRNTGEQGPDRKLVVTTLNCAEAKSLRELLAGDDGRSESPRASPRGGAVPPTPAASPKPLPVNASVKAALRKWLPPSADLYAVAVQECACWDEFRETALRVLNGDAKKGGRYVQLAAASIGSKRLKGHIGLAVFARSSDVAAGRVALGDEGAPLDQDAFHLDDAASLRETDELAAARVPLGTNLGVAGRSANKGCAGVRIRVGDAQLVFLGAHLPADAGGHARRTLRNACAGAALKAAGAQLAFTVDAGSTHAGAHLAAATHTFFLGDLNYRATPSDPGAHPRDGALSRVATALAASPKNKAAAWDAATADDELRRELAAGRAFSGFDERALRFAPTFRRKMGRAGIVQGSGAAALAAAYTLFKDEGSSKALAVEPVLDRARKCLSESQQRALDLTSDDYPSATPRFDAAAAAAAHAGLRHPAWTDRVLVHSLPRARSELKLGAYEAVELGGRTDHQPVRLTCWLARRPDRAALFATARAGGAARARVEVALDGLRIEGLTGETATAHDRLVEDLSGDGVPTFATSDTPTSDQRGHFPPVDEGRPSFQAGKSVKAIEADDGEAYAVERVSLFFPLPAEDAGAAARQARGVAAALAQDELTFTSPVDHGGARKTGCGTGAWTARRVSLTVADVPAGGGALFPRHCLVGVDALKSRAHPARYKTVAFAVVGLPSSLPGEAEFRAPLSLAGHARGVLSGTVTVREAPRDTAAQ